MLKKVLSFGTMKMNIILLFLVKDFMLVRKVDMKAMGLDDKTIMKALDTDEETLKITKKLLGMKN